MVGDTFSLSTKWSAKNMEVDRAAKPAKIPAKYLSPTEVKVSPSLRPCLFVRLSKILFEYAIPSCDAGYDAV